MAIPATWQLDWQRELLSFVALTLVLTVLTSSDTILNPNRADADVLASQQQAWCLSWNAACYDAGAGLPLLPCYNMTAALEAVDAAAPANASTACVDLWHSPPTRTNNFCQWSESASLYLYFIAGAEVILGCAVYLPRLRFVNAAQSPVLPFVFYILLSAAQLAIYAALSALSYTPQCVTPSVQTYFNGAIGVLALNIALLITSAVVGARRAWQPSDDDPYGMA